MDKDLHGEQLKLVRYKILFVKRDLEVAFPEVEEMVSQSLSDADFSGWKIAEFIQRLRETLPPRLWKEKNYPHDYSKSKYIDSLPEDDKRYLRVYYEVLDRYEREKFRYEQRQIEVLEQIRDILAK